MRRTRNVNESVEPQTDEVFLSLVPGGMSDKQKLRPEFSYIPEDIVGNIISLNKLISAIENNYEQAAVDIAGLKPELKKDKYTCQLVSGLGLISKLGEFDNDTNQKQYLEFLVRTCRDQRQNLEINRTSEFVRQYALCLYASLKSVESLIGINQELSHQLQTPLTRSALGKKYLLQADTVSSNLLGLYAERNKQFNSGRPDAPRVLLRRYMETVLDAGRVPHHSRANIMTLPARASSAWSVLSVSGSDYNHRQSS